ncbi:hypothetical protein HUN58_05120 [Curtobacterium sp. Csp1]|uniref:hypothetical protein n=1 Tax=unclassified Curtobacterium TaxID=257496 RepID=UPI00159794B7|nr:MULTISPECIES: hypothetical protein [unclassified Curtobacterium]QKS13163.1 hypothetical protein HUN60_08420 [Curtobacterium sp. csp3]QKS19386.1 hypothetical protein HUN58_05120 [Curtobacterium sp. Csp1]
MSVAVAATIALGATGCEFMSPAHTTEIKQITDGVNVTTGKLDIRNALFISDRGEDARFIGTVINTDESEDITLSIELGGDTQTVVVPAGSRRDLGTNTPTVSSSEGSSTQEGSDSQGTEQTGAKAVVFEGADARPGSLVKTYFSYSGAEGVSASVPVLTNAMEEYQSLAPSPSPTGTATPGAGTESTDGATPTGEATSSGN